MQEAVRLAQSYAAGMNKEEFLRDRRTQQAIVLNLITLGEVAARLMSEHSDFADAHPDIPWRQMRGMRNRMAHGYFDINLEIVWETVHKSLPELARQLDATRGSPDPK
jgi:uncharacterized protein with HEPN domain